MSERVINIFVWIKVLAFYTRYTVSHIFFGANVCRCITSRARADGDAKGRGKDFAVAGVEVLGVVPYKECRRWRRRVL